MVLAMAHEYFCIASGPSLTKEDVDLVRRWRFRSNNRRVIVTNRTYEIAQWADILFAMDRKFWLEYRGEVSASKFHGVRYTKNPTHLARDFPGDYGNSGAGAIELADALGAERIFLLGYDGGIKNGKSHWHEPYAHDMNSTAKVESKWGAQFEMTSKRVKAEVVNVSRHSKIMCFPIADLESVV